MDAPASFGDAGASPDPVPTPERGNDEKNEDVFKEAKLSDDSGFHSEENMKMLITGEVDAYVADNRFRS